MGTRLGTSQTLQAVVHPHRNPTGTSGTEWGPRGHPEDLRGPQRDFSHGPPGQAGPQTLPPCEAPAVVPPPPPAGRPQVSPRTMSCCTRYRIVSLTPELTRLEVKPRKMVQPEGGRRPPSAARARSSSLSGSSFAAICRGGGGGAAGRGSGPSPAAPRDPLGRPPPRSHHPVDLGDGLGEAGGLEAGGAERAEQRGVVRTVGEVVPAYREALGREGPAGLQHGP